MSKYLIGSVHISNGVIDEVDLLDYDSTGSIEQRNRPASVAEVVSLIKAGHDVQSLWSELPRLDDPEQTTQGVIPLQLITLPDGSESFEVVQRNQPAIYRTVLNLDVYDVHWTRVGLTNPHGARAGVAREALSRLGADAIREGAQ